MDRKKVTIPELQNIKAKGEKITMLTAYDYPMAKIMDEAGIDMILVGDSLGMVVLGYESTLPVTMDEMIHHTKAAKRGTKSAFLVGDMPFMSYQASIEDAVCNAGRFMKEGGCDAVKLEGGAEVIKQAKAIFDAGIPVVGHLGLTPQSATKLGGFKVQGKDAEAAKRIIDDALKLQEAGCFSIILECIPDKLAKMITEKVTVPTIGIGAGPDCDGQVLVTHDMVGLFDRFVPKFAKQYVKLSDQMGGAFREYIAEVKKGEFPTQKHSFVMKQEELEKV
ncbi:MAG: 3-methyl-2-oxobutanoate hydroxymethyltransferase [Candidatus Omnitrophica bacterium]|nr:3-methyl-2-oxobutanoate hydroxymethyltransferase [Candidatus Omnitrophota bacterium]